MMIPTVHLNGTHKKHLLAELSDTLAALDNASQALHQVTVHGRDYYPQGLHAYAQARTEMDARLAALKQIQDDLQAMHEAISKQGK